MSETLEGAAKQQVLDELVPLREAALLAYIAAFGIDSTISRVHRNDMAQRLCELLPVYALSLDRRQVRRLRPHELLGNVLADASLAVTRTALKAVVAALKTSNPG